MEHSSFKEGITAQIFYEDFKVGAQFTTESKEITQEMINQFAELTGDKNPIHLDEEAGRASTFRGIVAHGRLSGDVAVGLLFPRGFLSGMILLEDRSIYRRPVRPGDSIFAIFQVSSKTVDEKRSKYSGTLACLIEIFNQNNKLVLEMEMKILAPLGEPLEAS